MIRRTFRRIGNAGNAWLTLMEWGPWILIAGMVLLDLVLAAVFVRWCFPRKP